jgi:outer membrane protein TolC
MAAALREYIAVLERHFEKVDGLYQVGADGGSAYDRNMAGYELAAAKAQLAMAEGRIDEAQLSLASVQEYGNRALTAAGAAYKAGTVSHDSFLQATKKVFEGNQKLIELQSTNLPDRDESKSAADIASDWFGEKSLPASQPSISESIGVLKKIVERSEHDYNRAKELAEKGVVSATEVARAKSEYEISVERLRQGERALKYHRAVVSAAMADYLALQKANHRVPNSVSEEELRRAQLAIELARAKLEELSE